MSAAAVGLRGLALQADLLPSEGSAGLTQTCQWILSSLKMTVHNEASAFAGHIAAVEQCLQRLALGGIKLAIILQASTADQAAKQQRFLARYHLPEHTTVVTAQPRTLAVCLRQANSNTLQMWCSV